MEPRYYVQSELVRGEPRMYWVADRHNKSFGDHKRVSEYTKDKRSAERWCEKMNVAHADDQRK